MARPVCVVSSGVCAPSGVGVDAAFACALGETGDLFSKNDCFSSPKYSEKLVGKARGFESARSGAILSKCGKILFAALDDALKPLDFSGVNPREISLFFGTSIGGIFEAENMLALNLAAPETASWRELRGYECSTLAELAAKHYGFAGECATFSTACSSSSLALADACNAITQGDCSVAVVCGADAISRITVNGFGSLLLLSQSRARPFDRDRDGINLGEAAAVLVLASEDFAQKISGASPTVYVSGCACSADAYHATAPDPTGDGAARAILGALRRAGISACDVDFYCAHGTGTKGNDSAEFKAVERIFGRVDYASVKRAFGHTLGASGVLNAVLSVEAISRQTELPNLGYKDGGGEFSYAPVLSARHKQLKNVVSVSLGFGGNNSAAVFSSERNAAIAAADCPRKPLFVHSFGEVRPRGGSREVAMSELLRNTAPLKKRRFAKLQQIGLECATAALERAAAAGSGVADADRTGVCFGTGLGMTAETLRFLEAVISSEESAPIPSAFTNSVHNAVASAVSLKYGLKSLNSAATAKEISFEAALKQAWREINSGAMLSAVVGACDEYSPLADKFLAHSAQASAAFSRITDYGCAYFVSADNPQGNALAELRDLEISRLRPHCAAQLKSESDFLRSLLSEHFAGVAAAQVSAFLSCPFERRRRAFAETALGSAGITNIENLAEHTGANYSASAAAIAKAIASGAEYALCYTLSSTSMRSVLLCKILRKDF